MLKLTNKHMAICRKGKGEQNMNRNIVKLSSLTLTLTIVLSCFIAFHGLAYAQAKPKLFINPADNTFYTNQTHVGDTFTVSIMSADFVAPGVFSYGIKLLFDPTMLQVTAAAIPADHWLKPAVATNIFMVDPGTIDNATGFVTFAVTLLGTEAGKVGGGVIATVTFKIIVAPPAGGSLTSSIALGTQTGSNPDTILVDPTASPIPGDTYDIVPATFTYAQPPLPKPFLSVSSFTWDNTAADVAGRLFNVSVSINNLVADWHAVGFQFRLGFDTTMLATKAEWIFAGDFATQFGAFAGGTFNISYVEGSSALFGQIVLPPWPDVNDLTKWAHTDGGTGTLAIIQFNATYRPPPEASSDLVLSDVEIVDYQGNLIQTASAQNGTYTITLAPPPWLSVVPNAVELDPKTGTNTFDLNVQINNLDKGFQMVGAEFKVFYNTSVLSTTVGQITEGANNIMRDVATRSGTDLFFQAYVEQDHGLIGIILLPLPNGTWPFFPEGTGGLATVTFTVLPGVQDQLAATQPYQTTVNVGDVLLVNSNAKPVPTNDQKTATEGVCTVAIKVAFTPPAPDRVIDLFTQYTAPFGGQGSNVPSDAFGPQGQVQLFAKVTYRNDTVPNKPVAYQVIGANEYEFTATEFTDANGMALLPFTMPASAQYFGLWTIKASVDVAGQIVSDTLSFRFGWLVQGVITDVTNEGSIPIGANSLPELFKGKTYKLNSALNIITMQDPLICFQIGSKTLLTYTGFDELNAPLFNQYLDLTGSIGTYSTTVTNASMQAFVASSTGRTYPVGVTSITIPSSAFSGIANMYLNVYSDYPWLNGVPYSPRATKQVWIQAKPSVSPPSIKVSVAKLIAPTWTWTAAKAVAAGGYFTVAVSISNVDPSEHITAIQFQLEYDPNVIDTDASNVTVGPFVAKFGDTFLQAYVENNGPKHVLVGELQLPPYPGAKGWMTGSGIICYIKFKAVLIPTSTTLVTSGFNLNAASTYLSDADANLLNFSHVENGYYVITP